MAVTKIHPVKTSVGRAIDYVINPDKTNEYALVDTINCSAQTAEFDFKSTLNKSRNVRNSNQAFHLIQSFLPGEINAETAHQIGLELCDSLLGGKYSVVIGTHVDKHHIHNHILFCAVDNIEYKKYHDSKTTYRKIRKESDRLCEAHGLSVIVDVKGMSMAYREWLENSQGSSWKQKIKSDIKETIKESVSYDEFIMKMREKGYHIKGEEPDGSKGKYISFQSQENGRWVRGRETSTCKGLGRFFTREAIMKRIEDRAAYRTEIIKNKALNPPRTDLIDSSDKKKWIDRENLKRMSEAYSQLKRRGFDTSAQVRERIVSLEQEIRDIRREISENDYEIKAFAQTIKYINQYREYKDIYRMYKKSGNPEKYRENHFSEISLFEDAARMLKKAEIDPERFRLEAFKAEYFRMKDENKVLTSSDFTTQA